LEEAAPGAIPLKTLLYAASARGERPHDEGEAKTRTMKTLILIMVLGGLLAAAALAAAATWTAVGESQLSGHGTAALVLGVLASLALGAGLMFLVFYSSRRGHDEDAAG
jgi:hypothetical protein